MPLLVLQHCQPVTIHGPGLAADLALALSFSGTGVVNITASPNAISPAGPATSGTPYTGTALACTELVLHYVKSEDGPDSMAVNYALTYL